MKKEDGDVEMNGADDEEDEEEEDDDGAFEQAIQDWRSGLPGWKRPSPWWSVTAARSPCTPLSGRI